MDSCKNTVEFKGIIQTKPKVVVDFYAEWCGPCKNIGPIIENYAAEYTNVKFIKVDVDVPAMEEIAQEYDVTAMPTFLFFSNGHKVDTVVGANKDKVLEAIKKLDVAQLSGNSALIVS